MGRLLGTALHWYPTPNLSCFSFLPTFIALPCIKWVGRLGAPGFKDIPCRGVVARPAVQVRTQDQGTRHQLHVHSPAWGAVL